MNYSVLFEALESIAPIETAKVNVWALDNRYNHPPFLRFRYKGMEKNDKLYSQLKLVVEGFNGFLKWMMVTNDNTLNFIIAPEIFVANRMKGDLYDKDMFLKIFTETVYQEKVDEAIKDIDKLAQLIFLFGKNQASSVPDSLQDE